VSEVGGGTNVLGRTYLVMYTDGRGQAQTERGSQIALDQDEFVVLEVNGKHLLTQANDAPTPTERWTLHFGSVEGMGRRTIL
jgi:hypothetical protein